MLPLDILFEDNHCLAIAKPAPLLTQAPAGIPSLEALVRAYLKERFHKPGNVYLGIPHRLDRPVSGVVLFARNSKAAARLHAQFQERRVGKVYWAAVEGHVQPDDGAWEDWLLKIQTEARTERVAPDTPGARQARLHYRRLGTGPQTTLLEIQLETGRMHQIRVQAAVRGWPVAGDLLYGARLPFGPAAELPRDRIIALHARRLTFLHPIRFEPITVEAPLPAAWQAFSFSREPEARAEREPPAKHPSINMRIIPVLDILAGHVVRGIGGRRSEYRPIVSRLTSATRPLDVAEALRSHFGCREIYLADLDAIAGQPPDLNLYAELRARGFQLWVDAGIRGMEQAVPLALSAAERLIVGLETVAGPDMLDFMGRTLGWCRAVFSLDLKGGQPLGNLSGWQAPDSWTIAKQALDLGIEQIIVLDLERVGTGQGIGTEDLCRRLTAAYPNVELIAGGGVRGQADMDRLSRCGVHAVLVASALHDGMLKP